MISSISSCWGLHVSSYSQLCHRFSLLKPIKKLPTNGWNARLRNDNSLAKTFVAEAANEPSEPLDLFFKEKRREEDKTGSREIQNHRVFG